MRSSLDSDAVPHAIPEAALNELDSTKHDRRERRHHRNEDSVGSHPEGKGQQPPERELEKPETEEVDQNIVESIS